MSNSSEIRVSIAYQSDPNVVDVSPTMLVLPTTGQDLQPLVRYIESQTIVNNRNVADLIRVSKSSGGRIPCEMRWGVPGEALFEAFQAVMCTTEVAEVTVASCTTIAGNTTITRASGSFITDGFKVGDMIRNSGATPPGDNGYRIVSSVVALTLGVEGASFTGSAGNVSVKRGARLENGVTHRHYLVEISRLDIGRHMLFTKQVFNELAIAIATGAITTANFTITGGNPLLSNSPFGGSYTDPVNRTVMDAIDVPLILIGGIDRECSDIAINMTNNAVARDRIGQDGVGTIRRGQFGLTGSSRWYYDDDDEFEKFIDNQSTKLAIVQEDALGQAWGYAIPRAKYSQIRAPTNGPNQDDQIEASYRAIVDETQPYSARVFRFSA